ncbi:unnamed protein product [Rangifer tarandus platyrhynchus]|uniref:Uncharacterized protein n=1 Tax=Rangifer tarandus platyrhynchus TaxID=3082113 RepID=A0AC59ZU13_RANTA
MGGATPRKGRDGGRAFRGNGGRNRQPTRPESPPPRWEPWRPRQPEGVRPRSLSTRNPGARTPPMPQRTHALTTGGRLQSRHLSRTQAHTTEALPPPAPVAGVEAWPASAPLRPNPAVRSRLGARPPPCESALLVRPWRPRPLRVPALPRGLGSPASCSGTGCSALAGGASAAHGGSAGSVASELRRLASSCREDRLWFVAFSHPRSSAPSPSKMARRVSGSTQPSVGMLTCFLGRRAGAPTFSAGGRGFAGFKSGVEAWAGQTGEVAELGPTPDTF